MRYLVVIALLSVVGCEPPVYTSVQSEAIVGEAEAEAMQRMQANGTATEGDWRVYSKRNAERWTKVREDSGVK